MHDRDMAGQMRQIERLLDGRIATADHHHILAAIEEAVAGGAGGDAEPLEDLFARDAHPLGLGAGGNDQSIAGVDGSRIAGEAEGTRAQIRFDDYVVDDLGADMLGLLQHLLHQPGALDRIGEAGIVLDLGGDGELAALLQPGHQNRLEQGARGIDRGRIASRAGPDDQHRGVSSGHSENPSSMTRRCRRSPAAAAM